MRMQLIVSLVVLGLSCTSTAFGSEERCELGVNTTIQPEKMWRMLLDLRMLMGLHVRGISDLCPSEYDRSHLIVFQMAESISEACASEHGQGHFLVSEMVESDNDACASLTAIIESTKSSLRTGQEKAENLRVAFLDGIEAIHGLGHNARVVCIMFLLSLLALDFLPCARPHNRE